MIFTITSNDGRTLGNVRGDDLDIGTSFRAIAGSAGVPDNPAFRWFFVKLEPHNEVETSPDLHFGQLPLAEKMIYIKLGTDMQYTITWTR